MTSERRANVAEVVRLGREYLALDPSGSTASFSSWLHSALRNEDSGADAVEIVTFHAAKGLEWPIVHVAGLEKGFVPIHHAEGDHEALDEERRLLYVALTRARDSLHCSWAQRRAFGSRSLRRTPSPWLEALRPEPDATEIGSSRSSARRGRRPTDAAARSGGSGGRTPEDELFEALRAWRRERAKSADVPAFVVFNDATLREVARRRPSGHHELLDVPGIGAVKADRFGAELLGIVAEHRSAPSR